MDLGLCLLGNAMSKDLRVEGGGGGEGGREKT